MTTATAIRVTAEQLKKFGWRNVYDHMVRDLNENIEKYQINTPARLRHFLSQCAHESGLGQWTKELADGRLYEHRKQLGNVKPGDGPKYKGAGYLQLTGRSNYQKFANEMGDPRIMDGVEYVSKNYPWTSAGHFWKANNINALIDRGANVQAVTKVINGGLRGLKQREEYFKKFAGLVDSSPTQGGTVTTTARREARLIQPRPSSQGQKYTVRQGDSLWEIAQNVHVDVNAIKKANPDIHDPNNLQVGKVINIPSAAGGPGNTNPQGKTYKVQQGDSLWEIAQKVHVDVNAIKKTNPDIHNPNNLQVGKVINIPNAAGGPVNTNPQGKTYKVQQGDSLWEIAQKVHVDVNAIKKANPDIHNPNNLQVGQVVRIPNVSNAGRHLSSSRFKINWNNNHEKVWKFFKLKGFSDEATAGIMGNLQHESGMDPDRKQDSGGPGRGLCQWETNKARGGSGRWEQLEKYAQKLGKKKNDIFLQLEYLWQELTVVRNTKYIRDRLNDFGGLPALKKMNIDKAVYAFEESFEKAGIKAWEYRYSYAYQIYNRFHKR